jgi:hypothetical protein
MWTDESEIGLRQRCKQAIAQSGADYFFHCIERIALLARAGRQQKASDRVDHPKGAQQPDDRL